MANKVLTTWLLATPLLGGCFFGDDDGDDRTTCFAQCDDDVSACKLDCNDRDNACVVSCDDDFGECRAGCD